MREWWISREMNERRLMVLAGMLLGLIVFSQVILSPLKTARFEARENYQSSARALSIVRSELGALQMVSGDDGPALIMSADALRSAATQLALERGLKVSRLQTRVDGKIVISLEAADPRFVFAWLQEVELKLGASVSRFTANQGANGMIQASVDLQGAGG